MYRLFEHLNGGHCADNRPERVLNKGKGACSWIQEGGGGGVEG